MWLEAAFFFKCGPRKQKLNTLDLSGKSGRENMALSLLHRWREISPGKFSLVPEHIETRTLYHPNKLAEPQGQLLMWLDMFEEDTVPPSMPVEIAMRKPESYELRVVIWNTDEVIMADDVFFTGEKNVGHLCEGLAEYERRCTNDRHSLQVSDW
ncbi:fer-1-like protein 6 [Caerostris extrusa]|uniref:Fer-1-like protein 6 n=1 Tax=Caerostris extrusa TaxID=172846 RepID=A0AAV4RSI2_CAEEX|nr:fer-1-like protein 6 [Caerostris extrusa]